MQQKNIKNILAINEKLDASIKYWFFKIYKQSCLLENKQIFFFSKNTIEKF